MLHSLILVWFGWVERFGYGGIIVLMAMESSIFPVPSEIVMPPAAFWAAQGKLDFWGVVFAGTFGSYLGSSITYFGAKFLGLPFLKRYGKYFLFPEKKLDAAEAWVKEYGVVGVFIARLLPVIRHLISIPAGIFEMPFLKFSVVTVSGAFLWCFILSWFGKEVIGSSPELMQSPEQLAHVMKAKLWWFIAIVVAFGVLYSIVHVKMKTKSEPKVA